MARELRWRVRLAAGYQSDDEGLAVKAVSANGTKRKRSQADGGVDQPSQFKNFKPRLWEAVTETAGEPEKEVVKAAKPDGNAWKDQWVAWGDQISSEDVDGQADVCRRRDVIVKVRKTATGVERQKVERILEEWVWTEGETKMLPQEAKPEPEESKMEVDTAENKDIILAEGS